MPMRASTNSPLSSDMPESASFLSPEEGLNRPMDIHLFCVLARSQPFAARHDQDGPGHFHSYFSGGVGFGELIHDKDVGTAHAARDPAEQRGTEQHHDGEAVDQ